MNFHSFGGNFHKAYIENEINGLSFIPNGIVSQDLWLYDFEYKNMEIIVLKFWIQMVKNLKNDQVWMKSIFEVIYIYFIEIYVL